MSSYVPVDDETLNVHEQQPTLRCDTSPFLHSPSPSSSSSANTLFGDAECNIVKLPGSFTSPDSRCTSPPLPSGASSPALSPTGTLTPTSSSPFLPKSSPTPIPWRPVSVLLMLNAIQPLAFELIFPFVNQMILELGIVDDPERVGFYSGLIESIFAVMSLVAIVPCCYISDRYGRKPVILLGFAGLAVSTALFGVSTNFAMMVVTRCFGGAMGAAWSTMKVMIGEITDKSNQASVFSWFSISYRLGQTIGQPIGGLLSHPERNLSWFQGQFWHTYPFSLPCFIAAVFAALSVVLGYFNMRETMPARQAKRTCDEADETGSVTDIETSSIASCDYGTFPQSVKGSQDTPQKTKQPTTYRSILTPHVVALMISTVGLVIASETLFSLFPLFAFTPVESGGLGVNEAAIGTQMAVRSLNGVIVMFCYPVLERRLGTMRLYRLSMSFWPPCFFCLPLLNVLARRGEGATNDWVFWSVLWVYFTTWSFANSSWSGSSIMINDASPSQESLSAINGLNQMAVALPQAIAPAFATSTFAFSIKSGIAGGNLTVIILGVVTSIAALHSFTLKQPTHDWREDVKKQLTES